MSQPDYKELKPCPFCGGEVQLYEFLQVAPPYCYSVQCKKCCAADRGQYTTIEKAIKMWNTRVGQPTTNTFEDLKNKIARYEKLTLNWDVSSLTSDQRCELYELWGWTETETSLKNNLGDN